jgi:hypothetical protein
MYFYCYVYVFSLLCMFCSVYSVFIVTTGTLWLPWQVFPCFFFNCKANARVQLSKTGHGPHYSQLGDNFYVVSSSLILVWPLWVRIPESLPTKLLIVLSYVMFVCKCVLYYCHRVSTHLQLTNISEHSFLCDAMYCHRWVPMFQRNILHSSCSLKMEAARSCKQQYQSITLCTVKYSISCHMNLKFQIIIIHLFIFNCWTGKMNHTIILHFNQSPENCQMTWFYLLWPDSRIHVMYQQILQ